MAGVIKSQKGKQLFRDDDNFLYSFERTNKDGSKEYWRCIEKCRGRLHKEGGMVTKKVGATAMLLLQQRQRNEKSSHLFGTRQKTLQQAAEISLDGALQGASEEVMELLVSKQNISRGVRALKRRKGQYPPEPQDSAFEIPPSFSKTETGKEFILLDDTVNNKRILLFGLQEMLPHMHATEWSMDGTLDKCPPQFAQMYSIHFVKSGYHIPGVFALLPDKSEATYHRLFQAISDRGLYPSHLMLDFEVAAQKALSRVWPRATLSSCFFQLAQNLRKHVRPSTFTHPIHKTFYFQVQTLGLLRKCGEDPTFESKVKQLAAMAFLPADDVIATWEDLISTDYFPAEMEELLDYFKKFYIGEYRRGIRRRPLFPPELWNQNQRTKEGRGRTNNAQESWQKTFNCVIKVPNPSIWRLIEVLKQESSLSRLDLIHANRGDPPPRKNKLYQRISQSLLTLTERCSSTLTDRRQFLANVSRSYCL